MIYNETTWTGDTKIPWDEPEFSGRMLAEHLSQAHDLASRRSDWIDQQVDWIHHACLVQTPSRLLDLGCGPGFYAHRLARKGHSCYGIDFGPASIEYAQSQRPDGTQCECVLGDIRHADYGGPYDLALLLYGELNVFSPPDALAILQRARASLSVGGCLLVELQSAQAVEATGCAEASQQEQEVGLFSADRHCCRTESRWLADEQVAVQTFTVTELDTVGAMPTVYRNTTQAWGRDAWIHLAAEAGFSQARECPDWPSHSDALSLWMLRP
jgi:SAM-dependent methyltransferase